MAIKYDNCKDCHSRCVHAGKDRKFVCINGVSCKITTGKPQTNAVTVQKWISVDDELPEVGGYVVCIAKRNPFSRFMPMVARIEKNGWVNPITEQYISEVTHWMPLTQPPKGE